MLKHLVGKKFVGLLSCQDADLLLSYANQANTILEFGAGGSTLLFAQSGKQVITVEESKNWVEVTKKRLKALGLSDRVSFESSLQDLLLKIVSKEYNNIDLIFIDGQAPRILSAIEAWKYLPIGKNLIFHDGNSPYEQENTFIPFFGAYLSQISNIEVNKIADDGAPSSLIVVTKGKSVRPKDSKWKEIEKFRPDWSDGTDWLNAEKLWEYH